MGLAKPLFCMRNKKRKYHRQESDEDLIKRDELILSPRDKVVWAYKIDKNLKILKLTTVSYITIIDGQPFTVIYYDNFTV